MKSWGATNLVCSWQIVLSGLMSTMWLLTLGVIGVLFLGASIPPASIIVPLLAAGSVFWLIQHPDVLLPAARWVCAIVGKPAWAELAELQLDRLKSVKLTAPRFVWVSALSLGNWVFDIVALWACMWAVTGHAVVHAVEGPTTGGFGAGGDGDDGHTGGCGDDGCGCVGHGVDLSPDYVFHGDRHWVDCVCGDEG